MRARRRRVVPRLILHRRLRRWRLKQRARLSEIGLACAVGEETVMSNAVKAIGKNVHVPTKAHQMIGAPTRRGNGIC